MTRPASDADMLTGRPRFAKFALPHIIVLAGVALSHVHGKRRTAEVDRLQVELGRV